MEVGRRQDTDRGVAVKLFTPSTPLCCLIGRTTVDRKTKCETESTLKKRRKVHFASGHAIALREPGRPKGGNTLPLAERELCGE